jgi:hypothetical protein
VKKFKVGDEFMRENNGKVVTGEILADFGQFYLVMWHHMVGTFYLPAELVETYNKVGLEEKEINNNPIRLPCHKERDELCKLYL